MRNKEVSYKIYKERPLMDLNRCLGDLMAKTFFTKKFENARFHFSKKAIFEDQKVICVGSSDPSDTYKKYIIRFHHFVLG